jgi:hypothetical protein
MKEKLLTAIFLAPLFLYAQQPYTINWAAAPKNPVPFSYTSNHYGYSGKIKSCTEAWNSMSILRSFDENGLQQTALYNMGSTENHRFEYQPGSRQMTKLQEEAGRKLLFTQLFNEKNQLTSSGYTESQQYFFVYNDKGLLAEKQFPSGKSVTKYTYNEAGQLIKEELYRDTALATVYTYQYKTVNKLLEVSCTTLYKASGTKYLHKEIYNAAGMLVKEITEDEERTHSYQLDAAGNWINKKTAFKNLASKTVINKEWNRKIEYWP